MPGRVGKGIMIPAESRNREKENLNNPTSSILPGSAHDPIFEKKNVVLIDFIVS